jgi:hypothetical protein
MRANVIACADVAMANVKAVAVINLIIIFLLYSPAFVARTHGLAHGHWGWAPWKK